MARATLRALAARQGRVVRPGDRRGAGQDPARVPARGGRLVRRGRLAGPRRRAALLRHRRRDELVPGRARGARRRRADARARAGLARRRRPGCEARSTRAAASSATALAAAPAGSRSRAGATRSRRSSSTPRAPASCAPTAARRLRRWPTPTARRWRSPRSTRSSGSTPAAAGPRARRRCAARVAEAFVPGAARRLVDGARGRRGAGAGGRLAARLAAVGGRARRGRRGRGGAERLVQPDVLTPFGLRTLSSEHPAFRPRAYHRGAVWPFDCWLGWGGLRAAGRDAEAERVRAGVLAALDRLGRAPELYAVSARRRARAGPGRKPRAGLDRRRALGVRARLGRPSRISLKRASLPRSVGQQRHHDPAVAAEQHRAGDRGRPEAVAHVVERRVERVGAAGARTAARAGSRRRPRGCRARSRRASGPGASISGVAAASSSRAVARIVRVWAVASVSVCERVAREKSSKRSRSVDRAADPPRGPQPAARGGRRARRATASSAAGDRRLRPSARCAPIERRRRPTCTGRGSRLCASACSCRPAARPSIETSVASASWATSPTVVIPRAWSLRGGDRADAPEPLDRQRVEEVELAVGRHHEQAVGLGHAARDLGEELGPRDADRDRQADLLAHLAPQPHGDLRRRARRSARIPRTSRNASSIDRPSTSGDVSSNTSNTALLASE